MNTIALKKLWNENGIVMLLVSVLVVYGLFMFFKYLDSKGNGSEALNTTPNSAYSNQPSSNDVIPSNDSSSGNVQPNPLGNDNYASVSCSGDSMSSCSNNNSNMSDPSQLLPKDTNNQWSQLNPVGQGNLADVKLLSAGDQIGAISAARKNPNLQLRSEPPIQKQNVGIWNISTYEPDLMRPSLEIGPIVGSQ